MQIGFQWERHLERDKIGRDISRWLDNIKLDLRQVGWGVVECIDLARKWDQ
jgi:hypothetical protein